MNIVIVWTGLTGYAGDNWRALASLPGVKLKCYVEPTDADQEFRADRELRGLDVCILKRKAVPGKDVEDEVLEFHPDLFLIVGWHAKSCRWFATRSMWSDVKKVLVCDMPFALTPRKFIARFVLARYLRNFDAAFVPGDSSARYVKWLGFGNDRPIVKGLHCTDITRFDDLSAHDRRRECRFLYVGRYSEEKGIGILLDAYAAYRSRVTSPWALDCVGVGNLGGMLAGRDGVHDMGFKTPGEMREVYNAHDAFVLASTFEPWGIVLIEAAAAGLPIICTDACGAVGSVVQENGIVVKSGCVNSLADAFVRMHQMDALARIGMGASGKKLAESFSCKAWAQRVFQLGTELQKKRG